MKGKEHCYDLLKPLTKYFGEEKINKIKKRIDAVKENADEYYKFKEEFKSADTQELIKEFDHKLENDLLNLNNFLYARN